MTADKEWVCWTLCQPEIDHVAAALGIPVKDLSLADYDEIARQFRKGLNWALDDWEEILAEAVRQARGEAP